MACHFCGRSPCACFEEFASTHRVDPVGPPEPPPSLADIRKALDSLPPLVDYGAQAMMLAARLYLRVDELEKRLQALEKRSNG